MTIYKISAGCMDCKQGWSAYSFQGGDQSQHDKAVWCGIFCFFSTADRIPRTFGEILAGNDRTVQGYRPVPAAGETADGLHGRDVAADGNDPGSTGAGGRNKSCPNAGPGAADGAGPGDFALKILFRPKARGNRQSHRPDGEAGGKPPLPDEAAAAGNTDGGAG